MERYNLHKVIDSLEKSRNKASDKMKGMYPLYWKGQIVALTDCISRLKKLLLVEENDT